MSTTLEATIGRVTSLVGRRKAKKAARATEQALATERVPVLKEYRLGATSGSINVGWQRNGADLNIDIAAIKREGYDGVHIIGLGPDQTRVSCTTGDGITIAVQRGPWIVKLEGMTVEAGFFCAGFFGAENKIYRADGTSFVGPIEPDFQSHMLNVRGIALPPERLPRKQDGSRRRTKWVWFGYNCDRYWRNVITDATEASEHGSYFHGYAKWGSLIIACHYRGAGAQCDKTRSDTTETAWAGPHVANVFRDCIFERWHQTWSDRGGAGVVGESGACHWLFERCIWIGGYALIHEFTDGAGRDIPANERALCVGISSEAQSYDMATGRENVGDGNGWVIMRQCCAWGRSDVPWNNNLVRVGRNSGAMRAARGVLIEQSGIWGVGVIVSVSEVPTGKTTIRGCNTPALRAWAMDRGIDASVEAKFPTAQRLVPISEGIVR